MADQVLGDRYSVQQQLGRNAGRRTLVARDLETQELVVIKILSFSNDFEWDALKLFEREAETLKALSHPAIPRYLDYLELGLPNSKGFALVQTYVEGKSLQEHLKAGRTFTENEVRQIALDLLKILIYLHGRQPPVIHRDIKPSNILLTNRSGNSVGHVYLVDFGSVQTLAAKEGGTMTVVGTYGYMPLEQFGDRAVPASDLYSLGATLIALVTGTHPADLPQQDGRIQFEQVSNLSPAFASWLRWMTQPSVDRRLASAQKALQALEKPQQRDIAPLELNRGAWYWNGNNWIEKEQQNDSALLVANKPTGSKVSLTKNVNSLEILVPPAGLNPGIAFLCCFALAWNSGLVSWTTAVLATPFFLVNLLFALFSLPFWGVGIGMVMIILFALFGRVRLLIDRQQISLTYELFGFKYNFPHPARRQDISKLELEYVGDAQRRIIIWAGKQRYELGGKVLTEPELCWLVHELSDWLKLPIATRRLPAIES